MLLLLFLAAVSIVSLVVILLLCGQVNDRSHRADSIIATSNNVAYSKRTSSVAKDNSNINGRVLNSKFDQERSVEDVADDYDYVHTGSSVTCDQQTASTENGGAEEYEYVHTTPFFRSLSHAAHQAARTYETSESDLQFQSRVELSKSLPATCTNTDRDVDFEVAFEWIQKIKKKRKEKDQSEV